MENGNRAKGLGVATAITNAGWAATVQKRKLRIVKPPLPAIGICECCNSQFKSSKVSQSDAENEIKAAFNTHECKLADGSQRVMQDSAEDR